jgi:hypothetical protein
MAVRHGIEAAGINRASHRQKIVQESTVATLMKPRLRRLGSARVSRAGFGVSPKQSLGKSANRQHASRVRYPEQDATPPLVGSAVSHSSFVTRHFLRIQVAE